MAEGQAKLMQHLHQDVGLQGQRTKFIMREMAHTKHALNALDANHSTSSLQTTEALQNLEGLFQDSDARQTHSAVQVTTGLQNVEDAIRELTAHVKRTALTTLGGSAQPTHDTRQVFSAIIQKPSFQRQACDAFSLNRGRLQATTYPVHSRRDSSDSSPCSCLKDRDRKTRHYRARTFGLSLFATTESTHQQDCPLYSTATKARNLGARFYLLSNLLPFTVQATMSLAHGAGGLSISPGILFRSFVPKDSPSFLILSLDSFGHAINKNGASSSTYFESALAEIWQLCREGKAAPHDCDEDGNTLLMVCGLAKT